MITISVLGLDQYVVGHYSKDHTANLAQLFECEEDDVSFYAPNAMMFHNGVEQTSWNTLVIVRAPEKYEAVEQRAADYILRTLSEFSINVEIEFAYYEEEHHYEKINDDYPRFIAGDNVVSTEEDPEYHEGDDDDDEGPDPRDHAELDPNDPNQIYLGNALDGLDEKIAARQTERQKASTGAKPAKK
jgi:hypothetical protein